MISNDRKFLDNFHIYNFCSYEAYNYIATNYNINNYLQGRIKFFGCRSCFLWLEILIGASYHYSDVQRVDYVANEEKNVEYEFPEAVPATVLGDNDDILQK